jgi:hypothetical protein
MMIKSRWSLDQPLCKFYFIAGDRNRYSVLRIFVKCLLIAASKQKLECDSDHPTRLGWGHGEEAPGRQHEM